jgi:hypothetical protein
VHSARVGGESLEGLDLAVLVTNLLGFIDPPRERPTLPGGLQGVGGRHAPRLACRTRLIEIQVVVKRRARRGEPIPEAATLIVRGELLDPEALHEDAVDNFEVYGYWGISVFAEVGGFDVDQSPHYDVVHDDVAVLVERLVACPHRIIRNPAGPTGGQ